MRVLFLGEGALDGPARYLAAVLTWAKFPFDHRADQTRIPKPWRKRHYDVILISDYRYRSWTTCAREWAIRAVQNGSGLMMVGGWASFTGLVGHYGGTDLETLLPVRCKLGDDRANRPALLSDSKTMSVIVNGYHTVFPKPGTETLLTFHDLNFTRGKPSIGRAHPALVRGAAGRGRTLALMTDCAPHWAGGLIDWGRKRVQVHVPQAGVIEVGEQYLVFLKKWISWVGRRS